MRLCIQVSQPIFEMKIFNPFTHTTNMQQTTSKSFWQKDGKFLKLGTIIIEQSQCFQKLSAAGASERVNIVLDTYNMYEF